ncbi:MAG TPA: thiamine pyrophosphate-dependent enzyme, partial [Anaerolineaceae bacterium]|nr:thiamine pyrophosphate-dependent enzyme [Anaerolineaceae bacterium]
DRQAYRTREEVKEWMARDPIVTFGQRLAKSEDDMARIRAAAVQTIEAAVAFAEASPEPDVNTIEDGVYA